MSERGYIEGSNVILEWRGAEGQVARSNALAAELVKLRVDVLVALLTPAAQAAKKASSSIPIVMAGVGDPLGTGLVKSLARPGGNVTGVSASSADVSGKRIGLLGELVPRLSKLGLLINGDDPFSKPFVQEARAPAKRAGIELHVLDVRDAGGFDPAFAAMKKARVGAVLVQGVLLGAPKQVADAALRHHLPAASPMRQFALAGGLMSYGADFRDLVRKSAAYVDKILKGASPGDLPVEQPTKFEFVINRTTAGLLGLGISPALLIRADELID
jgi:putative ABC transport system substrate-binding protein